MRTGFTLIELLVVVLIIGILSAVALPQYEKAVMKSRMTGAMAIARTMLKEQDVSKMARGSYKPLREFKDEGIFPGMECGVSLCRVGDYLLYQWNSGYLMSGVVYSPGTDITDEAWRRGAIGVGFDERGLSCLALVGSGLTSSKNQIAMARKICSSYGPMGGQVMGSAWGFVLHPFVS